MEDKGSPFAQRQSLETLHESPAELRFDHGIPWPNGVSHKGQRKPEPSAALEVAAAVDRNPVHPPLEVRQIAATLQIPKNPNIDLLGCVFGVRRIAREEQGCLHDLRLDPADDPVKCLPISLPRFAEVALEASVSRVIRHRETSHVRHY